MTIICFKSRFPTLSTNMFTEYTLIARISQFYLIHSLPTKNVEVEVNDATAGDPIKKKKRDRCFLC